MALRQKSNRAGAGHTPEGVDCAISWQAPGGRGPQVPGDEILIQAVSGLMAVNGRGTCAPMRLGLDVASAAAGILASQGVLAALIARRRGQSVRGVQTSVLQGALTFLYHQLTIATCGDRLPPLAPSPAPGPPFRTADGHYVELEVLTFSAWVAFWTRVGVERVGLENAWSAFVYRYLAAACSLPASLGEATRRHTLSELRSAADGCGVAICRVRSYAEVLAELRASCVDAEGEAGPGLCIGAPWTIRPGDGPRRPGRNGNLNADAPLAGLRVVEVATRLQGPLAGHLLRMLGAEVIKVEPPGGDFGRHSPPLAGSYGAAYLAYNRGKKVLEIDYKRPEGRAQLRDLVADADVFLHNWRSRRAEKLGFDFEDFAVINPRLVYAHASGWGINVDEPSPIAGDFLVQAHAGCGDGLNPAGAPPFPSRLTLVDVTGGLLACEGVLAGLYLREGTRRGCRVVTSLLAGAMALQSDILRDLAAGREKCRHMGRPLWRPLDRPIETAEGFLAVAAKDARTLRRLSEVCDVKAVPGGGAAEELIVEKLRGRSAAEWEQLLLEEGIPAAVVCEDLRRLPCEPRVAGLLERVEGVCWAPGVPWSFTS